MLAIASQRADSQQRDVLSRVGSSDLSFDEVIDIQAVFTDTGALAQVEADITALTGQAIEALENTALTAEALEALRELAVYVGARDI